MYKQNYFMNLLKHGGLDRNGIARRYIELWELLYGVPFRVVLERDRNRIGDVYEMRKHIGYLSSCNEPDMAVTVLEVLVAFARRIDMEYIGSPGDPHPERIILEMVQNLGIDRYVKQGYNRSFVMEKLDRWMDRTYNICGIGGLFPVKRDQRDQRKLELWDQMMSYIHENYGEN